MLCRRRWLHWHIHLFIYLCIIYLRTYQKSYLRLLQGMSGKSMESVVPVINWEDFMCRNLVSQWWTIWLNKEYILKKKKKTLVSANRSVKYPSLVFLGPPFASLIWSFFQEFMWPSKNLKCSSQEGRGPQNWWRSCTSTFDWGRRTGAEPELKGLFYSKHCSQFDTGFYVPPQLF